jgi:NodT family efflux transporter outer membrane factor (OMF) lipoprotein
VTQPDIDVDVPEAWSAETAPSGNVDGEWWRTFNDPQLDRLVEVALERNWDLRAAVARLDRAEAQARVAGADLKPGIDAGLNASRQEVNFPGFGIPGSNTFNRYDASLNVRWEVDLWGRLRAGAGAAVADVQATQSELRGAKQSLAGRISKLWFAIAEAAEQVELSRSSAESFRSVAEQVRARYVKGVRPALDLRLALSNMTAAEASLQLRSRQLDALVRQLEVLVGDYPDRDIEETYSIEELLPTPTPVPAGLPAELIARRPDLVTAERRLAAADKRLVAARRALYPRLSLTASGGTTTQEFGDLLKGDFGVWALAANLTQPIFQGGRLRANIAGSAATRDEVLAFYAGSVLLAYSEVETALASEIFLRERERHLAESVHQLVAAERLADDRYRYGVGSYLELLESQTRAFVARSELLTVKRQRLENRVNLHLALGGGFEFASDENG